MDQKEKTRILNTVRAVLIKYQELDKSNLSRDQTLKTDLEIKEWLTRYEIYKQIIKDLEFIEWDISGEG